MKYIKYLVLSLVFYACSKPLSNEELQKHYIEARDSKNWKEALQLLDEKIKRTPNDANLYFARALTYSNLDLKWSKEMVSDLTTFLEYNPDDYVVKFIRAQALIVNGDGKKAIEDIDSLIALKGKNPTLLSWKANAAFADKQFSLAEQTYYERLKLPGSYEDLKNTYYYWIFSKYFGGNKEGAQWDCAFLPDRGFKEDNALMKAIVQDKLDFDTLSKFSIPNMTLEQLDGLITNNCSGIDIFQGKNYFRSELLEELAHLEKTEDLSSLLDNNEEVYALNLRYSDLTELPKEIFQLVNLQSIDLSGNRFRDKEKLFEDLSKLPNLKVLSLGRCNLRSLPDNITLLQNLEVLVIYVNGLREINENIGKLKRLKLLDLSNNSYLKDLPKAIQELRCLQRLDVAGSGLIRLREELSNCTELVSISANACKIKTLPEQIGNLINLKHFNLGYNKIEEIPISFTELSSLKEINLGSNELLSLPKEITKMQQIERVSFEFNRFKEFPKEILKLENLYSIWIHNNSFKEIPLEVAEMPKMKRILLDHQVITEENIEALKTINPNLMVERHDTRQYAKGRKRKK
ncbi:leucine-rich repeat domain-containing protein [Winogradskyella forsetii]|uniref:leucine-rich repeat domain-containing protein n=1 Tax=Winogradskyella forsetii TaxID=2686077 RepID=UPI0015C0BA61|nr:leucine-rich repeat domain-containing protein [Winogradskyella forsetii]